MLQLSSVYNPRFQSFSFIHFQSSASKLFQQRNIQLKAELLLKNHNIVVWLCNRSLKWSLHSCNWKVPAINRIIKVSLNKSPLCDSFCLPTWTPGIKEQDELDPRRVPQGQGVAAYRRIWCRADWQGHHVSGWTGDSSTPAGSVNAGRQTKRGPGAILFRGLRTCMKPQI